MMTNNNTTRQRILNAAIQVFANKGYHDTRVDEIVEASETSKGAVYFHFPSKQEIFLGLVDEFAELLQKQMEQAIHAEQGGVNQVDAALQSCLGTFGKYQKLAKIFLVQAVGLGTVFEQKRQEIHNRFITLVKKYLDEAVADGDIPAIDTEVAAYAWMGAINEVVIRWVYTGEPSPERSLPVLRVILLRSIGVSDERLQKVNQR
ncbi:MAG: TetR/AcrR family transcriptional regulator [Anaerolineales bacterium]|nr:TetR/AcrR family transcriptional regulator [Anaerolineales bacterium]